jgi:hypothetical protein
VSPASSSARRPPTPTRKPRIPRAREGPSAGPAIPAGRPEVSGGVARAGTRSVRWTSSRTSRVPRRPAQSCRGMEGGRRQRWRRFASVRPWRGRGRSLWPAAGWPCGRSSHQRGQRRHRRPCPLRWTTWRFGGASGAPSACAERCSESPRIAGQRASSQPRAAAPPSKEGSSRVGRWLQSGEPVSVPGLPAAARWPNRHLPGHQFRPCRHCLADFGLRPGAALMIPYGSNCQRQAAMAVLRSACRDCGSLRRLISHKSSIFPGHAPEIANSVKMNNMYHTKRSDDRFALKEQQRCAKKEWKGMDEGKHMETQRG